MRITRETLLKLAQESVTERVRTNRGIVSAYVAGSLLTQEPLLGGTTDIDLFFIHDSHPAYDREIVRLSPDVHLDIAHHHQTLYHHPRHLCTDLWLGSTLYFNPILLHDTQHWFEFTQASVRSLFWQADNVMRRARPLAEKARQTWMRLQAGERSPVEGFSLYLDALEAAANAIAGLTGSPLSERRFLIHFSSRAQAVEQTGLAAGLAGLLGQANVDVETVQGWIPACKAAFLEAGNQIKRLSSASRCASAITSAASRRSFPVKPRNCPLAAAVHLGPLSVHPSGRIRTSQGLERGECQSRLRRGRLSRPALPAWTPTSIGRRDPSPVGRRERCRKRRNLTPPVDGGKSYP